LWIFVGYVAAQARLQLLFKMHQGAGILFAQEARVVQLLQKDPLNFKHEEHVKIGSEEA